MSDLCLITLTTNGCNKIRTLGKAANENIYNRQWTLISRARFFQGTIVSLVNLSDCTCILNLRVEVNFHDAADPIDNEEFPFMVGEDASFILKNKPPVGIGRGRRIVIYEGQVTANGKNDFIGAEIKYHEDMGKFYDLNGKEAGLPMECIYTSQHISGYEGDTCIEGFHDPVYSGEWEITAQLHALLYLK